MKTTRRNFLITTAGAAASMLPFACTWGLRFDPTGPFQHGVASGDPLATSVILWTRITTSPSQDPVKVSWVVATDPDLTDRVDAGETTTGPQRDFTVKVPAQSRTHLHWRHEAVLRSLWSETISELHSSDQGRTLDRPEIWYGIKPIRSDR